MTAAVLLVCAAFGANMFDDTFAQANAAYNAGDYGAAIQDYERLVSSSVADPAVFYNLGNAYYRHGDLALAIANYERALHLNPDFTSARENLSEALRSVKRGLQPPLPPAWEQSLLFWHYGISYAASWWWAVTFWTAFWALLALRLWKGYRFLLRGAAVAGVLAILFGLSVYAKSNPRPLAVAVAETVPVRFGTNADSTVRFELYAGDRVEVDDTQRVRKADGSEEDWARVVTGSGERGWVKQSELAMVGPPYVAYTPPAVEEGASQ